MRFVIASVALHAAGAALAIATASAPARTRHPVIFEIVHASPPPAPATQAVAPAPVPPLEPPPVARASMPERRRAPAPLPAPAVEPPAAAPAVPVVPAREPLGDGDARSLASTLAPPAPPAPPEVTRAEKDATFVDDGFTRLTTLVQSWQHNDAVRSCIERQLGSGEQLASVSLAARGRMLAAVRRGDKDAALAEARRLRDTASSFDALYQRARRCISR